MGGVGAGDGITGFSLSDISAFSRVAELQPAHVGVPDPNLSGAGALLLPVGRADGSVLSRRGRRCSRRRGLDNAPESHHHSTNRVVEVMNDRVPSGPLLGCADIRAAGAAGASGAAARAARTG